MFDKGTHFEFLLIMSFVWIDNIWSRWAKDTRKTLRPRETKFSGVMKQRFKFFAWMPSVTSGVNQPVLITWHHYSEAWWGQHYTGGEVMQQCTETSYMTTCSRVLWTGLQQPQAHSQDNKKVVWGALCQRPARAQTYISFVTLKHEQHLLYEKVPYFTIMITFWVH